MYMYTCRLSGISSCYAAHCACAKGRLVAMEAGATVGEAMEVVVRAVEVGMVARMAVVIRAAVVRAVVVRAAPSTCPNLRS